MNLLYFVTDHLGATLIVALLLSVTLLVRGVRNVRRGRRRRAAGGSRLALAGAWLGLLAGIGATAFVTFALSDMAPALLQQMRIEGSPAPALPFASLADDRPGSLADHRGQVVLVNLWATWCPPCRAEMPDLERLQQTYRDRGLVVLQISDESRETIARFLESQPMTTVHGYVASFPWPAIGRPTTYLVDRDGVLRQTVQGARSYERFEQLVQRYL